MHARLALALLIPAACIAQAQAPAITFEKTHHDFGQIPADRKVTYRFKVKNTGTATLNITRINPSCGCTSTVLGKWSLEPGETTEVEASFDPRGFRGQVRKSIQVISDDPTKSAVTLAFEAEVIQEIMPSTTSVFFYDVVRTATRKTTMRLVSGNGKPVQVKEVKAPGAPYLATAVTTEGNDAVLDISLDGRKIAASKRRGVDTLTVVTTSAKMPVIPIQVQWEMKYAVLATPERVAWADAAGKALKSPVVLKQAEGKPFQVTSFKSSNPLISVEGIGHAAAAQQELQIALSPSAKAGSYQEQVILFLDDPNQPELTLRVSAILR